MLDELFPPCPRPPLEVASAEGLDQHLRLVQPRGVGRRQTRTPPARATLQVIGRGLGDVTGPAVVDQVHPLQRSVSPPAIPQCRDVVRRVVGPNTVNSISPVWTTRNSSRLTVPCRVYSNSCCSMWPGMTLRMGFRSST